MINQVLDGLRERASAAIHLDEDFFWAIPPDAAHDAHEQRESEQTTIGQLSGSWGNLVRLRESGDAILPCALVRMLISSKPWGTK